MGLTVLDAGVVIGLLDGNDPHHVQARVLLGEALLQGDDLTLPASALAELLVGAARSGDNAIETVDAALSRLGIRVTPIDTPIAQEAARLRAAHGAQLKLPDALVVATAKHLTAETLVTTDARWPPRRRMRLQAKLVVLKPG